MRAPVGGPGDARERALWGLLVDLESLRVRVPEAIMEGEAEAALLDAYQVLREYRVRELVLRPYSGVAEEARLLAQLAAALRMRMVRAGTPYVYGVDYFIERLDQLLAKTRAMMGLHPLLPATLEGDERGAWYA